MKVFMEANLQNDMSRPTSTYYESYQNGPANPKKVFFTQKFLRRLILTLQKLAGWSGTPCISL